MEHAHKLISELVTFVTTLVASVFVPLGQRPRPVKLACAVRDKDSRAN